MGGIRRLASLNLLLAAVPAALVLEAVHADDLWIFLTSGLAVIPLAGLLGQATESLASSLGTAAGGLLNATFGNAAELIIALMVVRKGPVLYPLVKASLTGSIIGNVLLVLGMAVVAGGLRHRRQTFNRTAASVGATLLALAVIGLVVPTLFYHIVRAGGTPDAGGLAHLSDEVAAILAVTYLLSLVFSLYTHQDLYSGPEAPAEEGPTWGRWTALGVLVAATVGVAVMSEYLAGSVGRAAEALGMSSVFVGVIVLAVVGNAAEHSTAVLMAVRDRMDLAVHIAIGSSIQVALFVAPVLVFASLAMGNRPGLDLHFSPMEVAALAGSVAVLALVGHDGETTWMEGVLLIAVYLIFALAFYNLPNPG